MDMKIHKISLQAKQKLTELGLTMETEETKNRMEIELKLLQFRIKSRMQNSVEMTSQNNSQRNKEHSNAKHSHIKICCYQLKDETKDELWFLHYNNTLSPLRIRVKAQGN